MPSRGGKQTLLILGQNLVLELVDAVLQCLQHCALLRLCLGHFYLHRQQPKGTR